MSHESAILDPVSNAPQLTTWLLRACAQIHETANEARCRSQAQTCHVNRLEALSGSSVYTPYGLTVRCMEYA